MRGKEVIRFWSGNRSGARRAFEGEVLCALLEQTRHAFGDFEIAEDTADVVSAEEARVFDEGTHEVLVTVAGNPKFRALGPLVVPHAIDEGLLGSRVLIIREEDAAAFASVDGASALKGKTHGIPLSWADATILRANGFSVKEEGDFDDLFERLAQGRFDYTSLGAMEVLTEFRKRSAGIPGLMLEPELLLSYPMPLVFYVRPDLPELATRVETGLRAISQNGTFAAIFEAHYGHILEALGFSARRKIGLVNPLLGEG